MANILIAYASMSGNTEDIANILKNTLNTFPHDVAMKELEEITPEELADYDGILIGCYTWGDGDLPYEAEDFYDDLEGFDLSGKKAAVFGSGDTDYPKFCEAVRIFEERLVECGAEIAQEGLKIELSPETDEDVEKCKDFAVFFAERLGAS
jgi:flavodoxin I